MLKFTTRMTGPEQLCVKKHDQSMDRQNVYSIVQHMAEYSAIGESEKMEGLERWVRAEEKVVNVISDKKEKSRTLETEEKRDRISRSVLAWANSFPDKPVESIKYELLDIEQGEETAMALSTIQGTYITKRFIFGGYQAEYQFKLIYRIKPDQSDDKRLEADELLNRFGDWAQTQNPDLGDGTRALRVEPTTQSSKLAVHEDGYEDYQILMKLTYEVNV